MGRVEKVNAGWELEAHVRPIDDLVEHVFSLECICGPTRETDEETGNIVVVHHSLDGRELEEPDYRPYELA